MSQVFPDRKRKAITSEAPGTAQAAIYDELGNGPLRLDQNEELDQDSDGSPSSLEFSDEDENEDADDGEDLESDEIPPEEDADAKPTTNGMPLLNENQVEEDEDVEDEVNRHRLRPFKVEQDANGNERYIYPEIEPTYDSDDSEAPLTQNTIGNIPLSFYDSYPHIGYDINGKKVTRPAKGAALDSLLDTIDIPEGWTGLTDPTTGKPLELSAEELDVLRKVTRNEAPAEGYDPYPATVEYFTSKTEQMPLSAAPEPKRRFIPSKHEHKRVMKLVRAIREGRIQPYRPPQPEDEDDDEALIHYDVWANEAPRPDHPMDMRAPKLPPPGFDESYHPPAEYLPDESERKEWEAQDDEDKTKEYLPADHDALRKVPGYAQFIKEKFERCLDLYLAPRVRRTKLNIDPDSLLPKLPDPDDLRPFPSREATVMQAHKGIARSVSLHPGAECFASAGDDGFVRVWSLDNANCLWQAQLSADAPVTNVAWRPTPVVSVLAATVGDTIYLLAPDLSADTMTSRSDTLNLLNAGFSETNVATPATRWVRPPSSLRNTDVALQISLPAPVKSLTWHRHGSHFVTVSPRGGRSALAIHTLSTHLTQHPLRALKGPPQYAAFHPTKPVLFVATQRTIRSYDLQKQELLKTLQPGAKWISSFSIHTGGDNLVVSSYDRRLLWMDLDLGATPYKTLRYHGRAIRSVKFHPRLPLFADCSDDGSVQVFHGGVSAGLMENASVVPLTVLRGHQVSQSLGVMDVEWVVSNDAGSRLISAGADGTCRVWIG
ncbi:MAG: hypothetical protein Q9162_003620 [Coniocarpon cinnabarinum]